MRNDLSDHERLLARLRGLIAAKFRSSAAAAATLTADEPLIGGRLGLDSLDALELGLQVEEDFGLTIDNAAEARAAFATLASLAGYITRHPVSTGSRAPVPGTDFSWYSTAAESA